MHSSTVQHQKSCEVSRLPDHDILIDYGLIVNRLIFGGRGGGGNHTPINRTASRIHLYINSNAGRLQRTNCPGAGCTKAV